MCTAEPDDEGRSPRHAGRLAVGDGHVLAWQAQGPVDGAPVLLLHGGPGSATSQRSLDLAASDAVRLIAFDQRGCGASTPRGATAANTTGLLLRDIEALRRHLGIARWSIAGGSWGATLALAAAARHPHTVNGLVLRNLFVPSPAELAWFFAGAAAWPPFAALLPAAAHDDLPAWLAAVFAGPDRALHQRASAAWWRWERVRSGEPDAPAPVGTVLEALVDRYRIQAHYLAHQCWLGEAGLQAAAQALPAMPVLFLHGERDRVCRPEAARAVQALLPHSGFELVPGAGHDPFHPALAAAWRRAITSLAGAAPVAA